MCSSLFYTFLGGDENRCKSEAMTQPDITCVTCLMDGRSTATTSASTCVYYQNSPGGKGSEKKTKQSQKGWVESTSPQPLRRLLPEQSRPREEGRKRKSASATWWSGGRDETTPTLEGLSQGLSRKGARCTEAAQVVFSRGGLGGFGGFKFRRESGVRCCHRG